VVWGTGGVAGSGTVWSEAAAAAVNGEE
jgi:hypothetical protein